MPEVMRLATSLRLSTRADLANSLRIPTSRPFSVGCCCAVDSESPEVDGAGGGAAARVLSRDGPADAILPGMCREAFVGVNESGVVETICFS